MEGILVLFGIVAALAFVDMLAAVFGVDSREQSSDPRSPARGIYI